MHRPTRLTDLQVDLAAVFFALDAAEHYLVAGGAALLASDLIDRPTEDLDLFAATPTTSVTPAKDAFVQALRERDCGVDLIQEGPTFCRMIVTRAGEETLVDLAIDSPPPSRPTITVLGPTLAPLELASGSCSPSSVEPRPATSPTSTYSHNTSARGPHRAGPNA